MLSDCVPCCTAFRYAEWYIGTKKHWVGRGSTLLDSNNIAILRHNVLPKLKPWVVWWPWLAVYLVPSYTVFGCVFDWRGSSFWLACFRGSKFYKKSANTNGGPCLTTKESTTQLLKTSRYKYNFLHGIYFKKPRTTKMLDSGLFTNNETDKALLKVASDAVSCG